jgi:hypothetical protein
MVIDSSGNVGIGTSSPSESLTNRGNIFIETNSTSANSGNGLFWQSTTSGWSTSTAHAAIYGKRTDASNGYLRFDTRQSGTTEEAMRIDSSGNLLVGSTTTDGFDGTSGLKVANSAAGFLLEKTGVRSWLQYIDTSGGWRLYDSTDNKERILVDSSGNINVSSDDKQIYWGAGTTAIDASSANNRIRFYTANSEAMRIDSSGHFFVGCVSIPSGGASTGFSISNNGGIQQTTHGVAGTSNSYVSIYRNANGLVGGIRVSGSGTNYDTSSDYRLKENVVYNWDATTRLKQLKPARFNFIADASTTLDGFLAHEAQAVVPECASGTHNEVDDDGNPVYQGIDQSKLVPLLVKTIQELEARITALENA